MKVLEELKPADLSLPTLPELCPSFRMSRLSGKPQNPIIDSLQFWNLRSTKSLPQIKVDHSESLPIEDDFGHGKPLESDEKSIWANATTRNPPQVVVQAFTLPAMLSGLTYSVYRTQLCHGTLCVIAPQLLRQPSWQRDLIILLLRPVICEHPSETLIHH